jgi:hypothetical protein
VCSAFRFPGVGLSTSKGLSQAHVRQLPKRGDSMRKIRVEFEYERIAEGEPDTRAAKDSRKQELRGKPRAVGQKSAARMVGAAAARLRQTLRRRRRAMSGYVTVPGGNFCRGELIGAGPSTRGSPFQHDSRAAPSISVLRPSLRATSLPSRIMFESVRRETPSCRQASAVL